MRAFVLLLLLLTINYLSAQIVNIEEMRITGTNDSLRWYGSLKGAFSLTKVKEQTMVLHAESRVQYKHNKNVWLLLLNASQLRAGNKDFVNSAFAHLRYNRKITKGLSWELYGQQQTNKLLLMKSRSLAGTGLRQRIFLNYKENSRLYLGVSYLFENNVFTENYGVKNWHRISNYISLTLRDHKHGVTLNSTTYWQPSVTRIDNYRFSSEWSLEFPITKHLRFSTDFAYSIDKGLPQAAPLRVYAWQNGVVWRL